MRVAVDTGGTFTDVVLALEDGRIFALKVPSTPEDPGRALMAGVHAALDQSEVASDLWSEARRLDLRHGTTVATNALLERKGARTLFVTTAGFEDLLVLGRQARPDLYSLSPRRREGLVRREDCFGLRGRLGPDRTRIAPIDQADLRVLAARIDAIAEASHTPIAVAVSLLHAYLDGSDERQVETALRALRPALWVSLSHRVSEEAREYERSATTVADAHVAPVMGDYIGRLVESLAGETFARAPSSDGPSDPGRGAEAGVTLRIMGSNGGLMSAETAMAAPILTAISGPAGGVYAAAQAGRDAGLERGLTFDMGGTSTDVGYYDPSGIAVGRDGRVGHHVIRVPMVDVHTVGAGGGSIARIDPGGLLKVGPESAGAVPGPACYGRGGVDATVSDANVVLGRLSLAEDDEQSANAERERARRACHPLATALDISIEALAEGIIEIANVKMARALRVMSAARGRAPETLALIAFGGAGGLHACELAAMVGIPRVLIPRRAGVLSAVGILAAPIVYEASVSVLEPIDVPDWLASSDRVSSLWRRVAALVEEVGERLAADDLEGELSARAAFRYRGQSYEIEVGLALDLEPGAALKRAFGLFESHHRERYGYTLSGPLELVSLRARAASTTPLAAEPPAVTQEPSEDEVRVWARGWRRARRVNAAFARDSRVDGPAIVALAGSTLWIGEGWVSRPDPSGALVLSAT